MVEITDREELKAWLEGRDRVDVVAIATRAALRNLPHLARALENTQHSGAIAEVFSVFRAARILTNIPNDIGTLAETHSHLNSMNFTRQYDNVAIDAIVAAVACARVSNYIEAAVSSIAGRGFASVSADVTELNRGVVPTEFVEKPLWVFNSPYDLKEYWEALKAFLLRQNENWEVWTDWYEDRLQGKPSNKDLERAIALMDPEKFWEAGPKIVNAEIQRLIDEHKLPPSLPGQEAAPINVTVLNGQITSGYPKSPKYEEDMALIHGLLQNEAKWFDDNISNQHGSLCDLIDNASKALGDSYTETNAIAVGFFSKPLAMRVKNAEEELMADTAARLQGFSANLDLFVLRLDDWVKHESAARANAKKMSAEDVEKGKNSSRSLLDAMREYANLYSEALTDFADSLFLGLGEGLSYGPETPYGFFVSIRNILIVTMQAALSNIPADIARQETDEAKKKLRQKAREFIYDKIGILADLITGMPLFKPLLNAFEFLQKNKEN